MRVVAAARNATDRNCVVKGSVTGVPCICHGPAGEITQRTMWLAAMAARIDLAAHAKYFLRCLELLPAPYASLDTNRLTVAYFCVSGLDVLGCLERVDAPRIITWIYSLQVRVRVRVRVRVSAVRTEAALRVLV